MQNRLTHYTEVGEIGFLSIARESSYNALNREAVEEIDTLLDHVLQSNRVKVLILGGEGNFAAGADIKAMVHCTPQEAKLFAFTDTFDKLSQFPLPTIAAIDGYALGGGLELALCCDFRLCTKEAKLGLPEINLGIMPGAGGTIRLPKIVGRSAAKRMVLLGEQIDAEQALKIGLVDQVVPKAELMPTATSLAQALCNKPKVAIKTAKETIDRGAEMAFPTQASAFERQQWSDLFATEDQKEGMQAFLEKRKPVYKGR